MILSNTSHIQASSVESGPSLGCPIPLPRVPRELSGAPLMSIAAMDAAV